MKRLLLAMLVTLMALPALARDFDYEYEGQTVTYTVLDENAKTVRTKQGMGNAPGNEVSGQLVIPSVVKDDGVEYTVTTISYYSFINCVDLTSVTIPNTVEDIKGNAFAGCI